MCGEVDLEELLRSIQPALSPETYVFVTLKPDETLPPSIPPIMTFRENEGLTAVVALDRAREGGLVGVFPSRLITLNVHSSLSAIGLLAAVTARLAAEKVAVNAVSAFFHDHLFVPLERADDALRILQDLAGEADGQE